MRTTLWSTVNGDVPANLAFTNNFAATTAPGVGNDSSQNYSAGSIWINTATNPDTAYICTDPTAGAAVWQSISEGGTPGQAIAPDASSATGAGVAALLRGGAGGTTSGAGGASSNVGGAATAGNSAGGAADTTGGAGSGTQPGGVGKVAGGAGGATGAGGKAQVIGGAGGATSGNGGAAEVTGGAATAGNGNGGSVVLAGGAKNGNGIAGGVRVESVLIRQIAAPAAKTTSGLLTGAEVAAGMIAVTQGGGADSAQQFPTGTNLQAALPADFAVGDSIDLTVINLGGASETATLTVNTDVTIVGRAVVDVAAATASGSGSFRIRKTADHVFVAYRIA